MFVAKVIDGQIVDTGDLNLMYPDTSFPANGPEQEWLEANSIVAVDNFVQYDRETQKLASVAPYVLDGKVYGVEAVALSQEEIAGNLGAKAASVRADRNRRLSESDWTQVDDAPVDKAAWAAYRQSLRDITDQEGFPVSVEFPLRPGEVAQNLI